MIVAVSRIPLPKTERYLYWVRVAKNHFLGSGFFNKFALRRAEYGLTVCARPTYIRRMSE